jgi:hypothetical protein
MTCWKKWLVCLAVFALAAPAQAGSLIPAAAQGSLSQPTAASAWEVPGLVAQVGEQGLSLSWQPEPGQLPMGSPDVTGFAALAAIPPGAEPVLSILQLEWIAIPAPEGRLSLPEAPLLFERIGQMRGVDLGRLVFSPQYSSSGARQVVRLEAVLQFPGAEPASLSSSSIHSDPLHALISGLLLNPQHLSPALLHTPTASNVFALNPLPLAVIEVSRAGLTVLDYPSLQEAGVDLDGLDPSLLRLERDGVQIPFEWEGASANHFQPGDRLLFYADPRFHRYSNYDAYYLYQGESAAPLISLRSGVPSGLPESPAWIEHLFEEERIYTPGCYCAPIPAGRDGERWVWEALHRPARPHLEIPFHLPPVDDRYPVYLTVWMIGYTDLPANPDHRVQVLVNDLPAGQLEWNGKQAVEIQLELPAHQLIPGQNRLGLHLPGLPGVAVEGVWLDAFRVMYAAGSYPVAGGLSFQAQQPAHRIQVALADTAGARAYDVSDPDQPVRLTGIQLSQPGTVSLSPGGQEAAQIWLGGEAAIQPPIRVRLPVPLPDLPTGADYLVISPLAFAPALDDLLALRQEQGLQTVLVPLEAVYDTFGRGIPDPLAIHSFVRYAYETWQPAPAYLLLVGDGTYDPRRYLEASPETYLPPFLAEVDPWAGETAADNRYAVLSGDGSDLLPDLMVGRLPVSSYEEARQLVAKIVAYERQPASGPWAGQITFTADNADTSGVFAYLAETLARGPAAPPLAVQRWYHRASADPALVREGNMQAWNEGRLLMVYFGHASLHQWASENFLHAAQVSGLQNGSRLPVLLSMSCLTGSFHTPGLEGLDEVLLRHPHGGVIAAWGSTGLGVASGHLELAEGFMISLFGTGEGRTEVRGELGAAALAGKLRLAAVRSPYSDLIDTFTLLGDPASRLNRTHEGGVYTQFLPAVQH